MLQLEEMEDNYVDYCSFEALITGVKFYAGECEIRPMLRVLLVRDHGNGYDDNAVMAKALDSRMVIGHLDKKTAAVVAPIIDNYPIGLIITA